MLLKRLKQNLFNQYKDQERKTHNLSYLFWECTQRCNLKCLHCGSDCLSNSSSVDMPADDLLRVLDDINQYPHEQITVVITGGEPLLRNDLEYCGIKIREKNFRWSIVTNGYAYTRERHISLLNAGMGAITLSFDGLELDHNWLRNNNKSYHHALNAMELIAKEERLNFDVVTCVNKKNLKDLESIRQMLVHKGVKAWRLFTITPIGRASGNDLLKLSAEEFTYLMNFIEYSRNDKSISVNFSCEGYIGKYEGKVRDNFFFCRAGINIGSVLINGDISACPNINRSFVQGNIYKEKFTDVWNRQFELFRNRDWMKVGTCATCDDFKYCGGNGFHFWSEEKSEVGICHLKLIK